MKYLAFVIALYFSTAPCFARKDLWIEADTKLGQTVEIKDYHVQECQRRYDQWGLMDVTGKIKPIPVYRLIGIDESGNIAARVLDSNLRKLINPRGEIIPKAADLEIVNIMTEARIPVKYHNKAQLDTEIKSTDAQNSTFSFCTSSGNVLSAKFDQVSPFNNNVAAVRMGKSVGFIGLDGKYLPNSKMVNCQFREGVSEGRLAVCVDSKWGYIDTSGNWIVEPKFEFAKPFQNGFALVGLPTSERNGQPDKSVTFIDKTGKQFAEKFYSGKPFEGEYATVSVLSSGKNQMPLWGLINRAGQWIVEPKFSLIGPLVDSARLLYAKDLVGVFSNGRITVQPTYKHIGKFCEGLAPFQVSGGKLYGFLAKDGKVLVPAKFAFAGTFSEGLAAVRTYPTKAGSEGKIGFVDKHGAFRIAPTFGGSDPSNPEFNADFVQFHDGICLIPERSYWDGTYWCSGKGYINRLGKWIGPGPEVITMGFPFRMGSALVRYYPKKLGNRSN